MVSRARGEKSTLTFPPMSWKYFKESISITEQMSAKASLLSLVSRGTFLSIINGARAHTNILVVWALVQDRLLSLKALFPGLAFLA